MTPTSLPSDVTRQEIEAALGRKWDRQEITLNFTVLMPEGERNNPEDAQEGLMFIIDRELSSRGFNLKR